MSIIEVLWLEEFATDRRTGGAGGKVVKVAHQNNYFTEQVFNLPGGSTCLS
ncbi:MAG: hypothetical protein ACRD9R_01545 [Pyrinomonadaceae bacterium]